jgi:hypothetical protein
MRQKPSRPVLQFCLWFVEDIIEHRMIVPIKDEAGIARLTGAELLLAIKFPFRDHKRLADGIKTLLGIRPSEMCRVNVNILRKPKFFFFYNMDYSIARKYVRGNDFHSTPVSTTGELENVNSG